MPRAAMMFSVVPAPAGTQGSCLTACPWFPAFAGMMLFTKER
jgi:hypothetical protein